MEADLRTKEARVAAVPRRRGAALARAPCRRWRRLVQRSAGADSRGAIVAPFAGVVDSVSVATGEIVDPATPIFTVSDLSTVWVQADVAERDLGAVKVGDAVEVRVSAFPGRVFAGRVTYIPDQIESATGMAKVRCEVPNPDGALRVNMFATVTILSPQGGDAVLVPSRACRKSTGRASCSSRQEIASSPGARFIPAWSQTERPRSRAGSRLAHRSSARAAIGSRRL